MSAPDDYSTEQVDAAVRAWVGESGWSDMPEYIRKTYRHDARRALAAASVLAQTATRDARADERAQLLRLWRAHPLCTLDELIEKRVKEMP